MKTRITCAFRGSFALGCALAATLGVTGMASAQTVITGNGGTGFAGPVGGSTLSVAQDGGDWVFTLTKGSGSLGDALVLYFDTTAGGFSSTEGFTDAGDLLRKAISGYDGTNRSTVTFPDGFGADFAIALSPAANIQYGGLWTLVNGGSHVDPISVTLTPSNDTASTTYSFRIARSALSAPLSGTVKMVGTYLNASNAFRSNEGYGAGLPADNTNVGQAACTFTSAISIPVTCTDADNDGACAQIDCDDDNAAIKPGAPELCASVGVDNDCDGNADEVDANAADKQVFYADGDGDGFGNAASASAPACSAPANHVANSGDCDDSNAAIKPGATEICDGVDNNCVSGIDEGVKTIYYRDIDGDGFGNAASSTLACSAPEGYVANSGDCNDSNAAIKPGATEICDGVDNNCVGGIDEGVQSTFYQDIDGDGFGNAASSTLACSAPEGYVANSDDCNDAQVRYSDADADGFGSDTKIACGGVTNSDDCDDAVVHYSDADTDGFGSDTKVACDGVTNSDDCNDAELQYADGDSDTYGAGAPVACGVSSNTDCDDSNAAIKPGATEICDGVDNNCVSGIDEGVKTTYYRDIDGDGFGNAASSTLACSAPEGYVANSGDCNDSNAAIKPGVAELCASVGVDNDCDGNADEVDANAADKQVFYADGDGDGFGDAASASAPACSAPANHVANSDDCDDTEVRYSDVDVDGFGSDTKVACGGVTNSDDCDDAVVRYSDVDVDGFGSDTKVACGGVTNSDDCDDAVVRYSDADTDGFGSDTKVACDGVTNSDDCDDTEVRYSDVDADGFGSDTKIACGGVTNSDDCDDAVVRHSDVDVDGFGSDTKVACGGVTNSDDCNDAELQYADGDSDTYGAGAPVACGVSSNTDCNDGDDTIYLGAAELCATTSVNNDCDNTIDDVDANAADKVDYFRDQDLDGHSIDVTARFCPGTTNAGYRASLSSPVDCNDDPANGGAAIYPGAPELCGTVDVDNDCDLNAAEIDANASDRVQFYTDNDGDNATLATGALFCAGTSNAGYRATVSEQLDCNDADAAIFPGAPELCGSVGVDNDCDSNAADIDANASDRVQFYSDADGDTFTLATGALFCAGTSNAGYRSAASASLDCNDAIAAIFPGATEVCNQADDDCDSTIDEGFTMVSYFTDADADGYGSDSDTAHRACSPIAGKAANNLDCDDTRATAYFGAPELCNGLDDDCDGAADEGLTISNYYTDSDADGFGASNAVAQSSCTPIFGKVTNNTDCNDSRASANPAAPELCNGLDDDCDSAADEGLSFVDYYTDSDSDNYGASAAAPQSSCAPVNGKVSNNLDCDDISAAINPGQSELCDGVDQDCDSQIDEGLTFTTYYRDADSDTFGSSTTTVQNCTGTVPTGYVLAGGDCDDTRVLYADSDNDGIGSSATAACGAQTSGDNCPTVANADQANCDSDADGNACDANDDNDAVADINDAYPCDAAKRNVDSAMSAAEITAFLATATAATVDATGMDAARLAAVAAGAARIAPNGITGTFTITAALSPSEISAILGNLAATFTGGATVTIDGAAIPGTPGIPAMTTAQFAAVVNNIGVVSVVQNATITSGLTAPQIAALVNLTVAPQEAVIVATGMDAAQLEAAVSGTQTVLIIGSVLIDADVDAVSFTEILASLSSPTLNPGTTVQFDTAGMDPSQVAAVNAAIASSGFAGTFCNLADLDFDLFYTMACIVARNDCNDGDGTINPGNPPVLANVPASFSVPADAGTALGAAFTNPVTASDPCEGDLTSSVVISVMLPGATSSSAFPANGMFPVGTSSITWTVVDALGNFDTQTRTITVLNHQLLDAVVAFNGVFADPCTRQIRVTIGGSSAMYSLSFPAGLNPAAAIADVQVPVAAGYACIAAKDLAHSITDAAAPSVVAKQYAAAFVLRQGDANNDDVVDIFDYAAFINARGIGRASDAVSNYNGDTEIDTFDFSFVSAAFLATGDSCSASFNPPTPRTRVSVKDLRRAGLGHLAMADINLDGWVDLRDVQLTMQGVNGPVQSPSVGQPISGTNW